MRFLSLALVVVSAVSCARGCSPVAKKEALPIEEFDSMTVNLGIGLSHATKKAQLIESGKTELDLAKNIEGQGANDAIKFTANCSVKLRLKVSGPTEDFETHLYDVSMQTLKKIGSDTAPGEGKEFYFKTTFVDTSKEDLPAINDFTLADIRGLYKLTLIKSNGSTDAYLFVNEKKIAIGLPIDGSQVKDASKIELNLDFENEKDIAPPEDMKFCNELEARTIRIKSHLK